MLVGALKAVQSLMEIVVRSYKNLVRNMFSYKIQSFLIRLKILVK